MTLRSIETTYGISGGWAYESEETGLGLYDRLKERKRSGEKLDMKTVNPETLYTLWWREECTDAAIADLYGVDRKKVTNLRHKWGVKAPDTIVNEFAERFEGEISKPGEDEQAKPVSRAASALIRKIHDLNDLELESLRLELGRRYTLFADVKQEVEFLAAVEKVIQQFWTK